MRFGDGTPVQKAIFWALVLFFAAGLAIAAQDKAERVGGPDLGFFLDDGGYASPSRSDSAAAGLRGGGRVLSVNGIPVPRDIDSVYELDGARFGIGETNRLVFEHHRGDQRELVLPVRPWEWDDVLFSEGAVDLIALAFFGVGLTVFLLRPWQTDTWALLTIGATTAGVLLTYPIAEVTRPGVYVYQAIVYSYLALAVFHLALAYPVVHPVLRPGGRLLPWIYLAATIKAALGIYVWAQDSALGLRLKASSGLALLTMGAAFAVGRCVWLAFFSADPFVRQRARILLGGIVIGLTPVIALEIARDAFHVVTFDSRFTYWMLAFFLIALARITVRTELMNARIAVRRAFIYTVAVGLLTTIAIALSAERSYAVAVLLFPLLYFWPRFDARLNAYLYRNARAFPS